MKWYVLLFSNNIIVNMTKYALQKHQICRYQMCSFQLQMHQKPVFSRGSAPDPARAAYDAPPDALLSSLGSVVS